MTIAFDFDNVIHKYRQGWQDGKIYDDLDEGMLHLIAELLEEGHKVFIMTTRSRFQVKRHFENLLDMYDPYYDMHFDTALIPFKFRTFGLFTKFWNKKGVCGITNRKAVFDVLIDDRAMQFIPSEPVTKEQILAFKPRYYPKDC